LHDDFGPLEVVYDLRRRRPYDLLRPAVQSRPRTLLRYRYLMTSWSSDPTVCSPLSAHPLDLGLPGCARASGTSPSFIIKNDAVNHPDPPFMDRVVAVGALRRQSSSGSPRSVAPLRATSLTRSSANASSAFLCLRPIPDNLLNRVTILSVPIYVRAKLIAGRGATTPRQPGSARRSASATAGSSSTGTSVRSTPKVLSRWSSELREDLAGVFPDPLRPDVRRQPIARLYKAFKKFELLALFDGPLVQTKDVRCPGHGLQPYPNTVNTARTRSATVRNLRRAPRSSPSATLPTATSPRN